MGDLNTLLFLSPTRHCCTNSSTDYVTGEVEDGAWQGAVIICCDCGGTSEEHSQKIEMQSVDQFVCPQLNVRLFAHRREYERHYQH